MHYDKRPWGFFIKFIHTKSFWLKFIYVRGRTSLQSHHSRRELHIGTSGIHWIRKREIHRLSKGIYLELAFGEPKEEDIIRLKDDYGRI